MKKRYWYVILSYIIMQFSGILFAPLLFFLFPISEYEAIVYWSIFSFIVGLVVVLLLMRPDMKIKSNRNATNAGYMIFWSIAGFFMALFGQALAVYVETEIFGIEMGSANTQMIVDISRATPLFIIIPILAAPILEEIIFRKIIFGTLYSRIGFFLAALASALIFAVIHGEPQHILIYGSVGFIFAFIYVKTKHILVPIIVHMAINTFSVVGQLLLSPEEIEKMQRDFEQLQTILGVG